MIMEAAKMRMGNTIRTNVAENMSIFSPFLFKYTTTILRSDLVSCDEKI